jgi:hypothetical protein
MRQRMAGFVWGLVARFGELLLEVFDRDRADVLSLRAGRELVGDGVLAV